MTLGATLALAASSPAAAADTPLTGTGWQLVRIDAADGPTTVADPSTFTVAFGPDGYAALRMDCNRGRGSWQATATGPYSGTLSFGPIATTLMMCPQPSLDTRVGAALADVGGWRIEDGQLTMTPVTGDGTLVWVPLP